MKTVTRVPSGIVAALVRNKKALRAAFAVRHEAYCVSGLMACDLRASDPHDQWDSDGLTRHYMLSDNGEAIGSARAIDGKSIHGLQASSFIELEENQSNLIEVSRVAMRPTYRGNRHEALLRLLGALIQDQWQQGNFNWVQTMRAPMATILARRFHIPFEVTCSIDHFDRTARGVPLSGESLFLARVDLRQVAAHTFARDTAIYEGLFGLKTPLVVATEEENAKYAEQISASLTAVKR